MNSNTKGKYRNFQQFAKKNEEFGKELNTKMQKERCNLPKTENIWSDIFLLIDYIVSLKNRSLRLGLPEKKK